LPDVSKLARPAIPVFGKRFFSQLVKLARLGIAFDLLIEQARIQLLVSFAELGLLLGGQLKNGLFDLFKLGRKMQPQIRPSISRRRANHLSWKASIRSYLRRANSGAAKSRNPVALDRKVGRTIS